MGLVFIIQHAFRMVVHVVVGGYMKRLGIKILAPGRDSASTQAFTGHREHNAMLQKACAFYDRIFAEKYFKRYYLPGLDNRINRLKALLEYKAIRLHPSLRAHISENLSFYEQVQLNISVPDLPESEKGRLLILFDNQYSDLLHALNEYKEDIQQYQDKSSHIRDLIFSISVYSRDGWPVKEAVLDSFSKIIEHLHCDKPFPFKLKILKLIEALSDEANNISWGDFDEKNARASFKLVTEVGYFKEQSQIGVFARIHVALLLINHIEHFSHLEETQFHLKFMVKIADKIDKTFFTDSPIESCLFDHILQEMLSEPCLQAYDYHLKLSAPFHPEAQEIPKVLHYVWAGRDLPQLYLSDLLLSYGYLQAAGARGVIKFWTTRPKALLNAIENLPIILPKNTLDIVQDLYSKAKAPIQIIDLSNENNQKQFSDLCRKLIQMGLEQIKSKLSEQDFIPYAKIKPEDLLRFIEMELIGCKNYAAWADMVRLIALYFGGLYLDLDCRLGGPLEKLMSYGFSYQGETFYGDKSGKIKELFARPARIPLLNNCLMGTAPANLSIAVLAAVFVKNHHEHMSNSKYKICNLDRKRAGKPNGFRVRLTKIITGPACVNSILVDFAIPSSAFYPNLEGALEYHSMGVEDRVIIAPTIAPKLFSSRKDVVPNTVVIRCDGTWYKTAPEHGIRKALPMQPKYKRSNSLS